MACTIKDGAREQFSGLKIETAIAPLLASLKEIFLLSRKRTLRKPIPCLWRLCLVFLGTTLLTLICHLIMARTRGKRSRPSLGSWTLGLSCMSWSNSMTTGWLMSAPSLNKLMIYNHLPKNLSSSSVSYRTNFWLVALLPSFLLRGGTLLLL